MDGWHVALYAMAVFLAVRTLVGLMKAHELALRQKRAEDAASQEASAAKVPEPHHVG